MLFNLLIVLCFIAVVAAEIPSNTKVSASIKDTNVNGIEGFNFNVVAPFKFQEYVVGFRYALGNIKKAPESLFARRSFDTLGEGSATVEADYNLGDNTLNVDATWKSDSLGLSVGVNGDSKKNVKAVSVSKNVPVNDNKVTLTGVYDVLKKKVLGHVSVDAPQTVVDLKFDSEEQDPVLSVSRAIDDNNEIIPSIALRSGAMSYGYKRNWEGGSLKTTFFPGKKVSFDWKDEGASGTWATTAEVPLADTKNTKVSFTREWNY
jgi:hypothetical protein